MNRKQTEPAEGIVIRGLFKSFGDNAVLRDLNAGIRGGKITCITGPSGCGKTTLLSILLGLFQADSGEILGIEGLRAAAVFQEDRLCGRLNALANILLVCGQNVRREDAAVLLEQMGIEHSHHLKPVCELSGGMRRRVALARALMAESDWLALDEPFKGLDEQTRRLVQRELLLHTKGKTVLLITHEEEDIQALQADRLVLPGPLPSAPASEQEPV